MATDPLSPTHKITRWTLLRERRGDSPERLIMNENFAGPGGGKDAAESHITSKPRADAAERMPVRRQGLNAAISNADPWWTARIRAAIAAEAERTSKHGGVFSADDLRDEPHGLSEPDAPCRWGAAFALAHRDGLIAPAGFTISRRRERAGGVLRIWRGVPRIVPTSASEPTMTQDVE